MRVRNHGFASLPASASSGSVSVHVVRHDPCANQVTEERAIFSNELARAREDPLTPGPAQRAPQGHAASEHAVGAAVARLRTAVGADLVRTVKRGYRLAVETPA